MNAMTEARFLTKLDDRFNVEEGRIYLNGMQALLRLMLDQRRADMRSGLNTAGLVSGYPGSPVGGVDHVMLSNKKLLDAHHIVFQAGLNEELAATAVWGSQTLHTVPSVKYDGVFGMWYGKAPGVDRAADALHHANFRGVAPKGGVLVVAGDDPHARSTICPSDSTPLFASFYMPVLAPSSIQEIIDFGLHGYALSRASGLWVGFKLVNDLADSCATAEVSPTRVRPVLPEAQVAQVEVRPLMNEGGGMMLEPERLIHDVRLQIVRDYARLNKLNAIVCNPPTARFGILTGGKTYVDVREALSTLGYDDAGLENAGIRILKMGLLYPVENEVIEEFAEGLDEIFVAEDKRAFLEVHAKEALYPLPRRPRIVGKLDDRGGELLPSWGELSAELIAAALVKRLTALGLTIPHRPIPQPERAGVASLAPVAARTPYFCSGCPHNRSLRVPEGSVVGAGIGCHIMTLWMPGVFGESKGYTQMGGEGAQWIGLAPFTDTKHFYQNLGDGTFHHSGSLAIRGAVAAGTNITYKILYNRTVAMTGGQDVTGALSVAQMVDALHAEGVRRIIVTTDELAKYPGGKASRAEVWHRDRLLEAEKELAATPGVTVLINDQHCAAEKRRLRKRGKMPDRVEAAFINTRVCEGCGDCGAKSNCLSVQPVATEFGRKTQIHQSSCNQDLSCLDGDCPSFLTVRTPDGKRPRPRVRAPREFPADSCLPQPQRIVPTEEFSAALVGIGGTGVVTVNQILGMAAFMEGRRVQTYDHTGSSQKAGPVVSHLKIFRGDTQGSPTVTRGAADLYLAFDSLGAVSAANLAMAAADRTVAVVSTSMVPTGSMVSNVATVYPAQSELSRRIDAVTRPDHNVYVDGQRIAERLLGDHMASNLFMVGVAYQLGALPIGSEAIEVAIRLNGAAAKMNLDAFRWGRLYVADPSTLEGEGRQPESAVATLPVRGVRLAAEWMPGIAANSELSRVLAVRIDELVAYQDEKLARSYAQFVQRVCAQRPQDVALQVAVARNLYKLLAYKDEYEVARLHLEAEAQVALNKSFGDVQIQWNFHPTFLRSLGVRKKVRLGEWFRPILRVLRAMKGVRGTAFDLLGKTHVRRIERALPGYYMAMLEAALVKRDPDAAALMELAQAPDKIRGYEDVKLRNVARFIVDARSLQARLAINVTVPAVLREDSHAGIVAHPVGS